MIERLAIFKCPLCSENGNCPSLDLSMYIEHYARRHMSNFHLYECRQCTKKFATAFVASYHIKMGKCRKEEGELCDDGESLLNTVPIEEIDCSYLYGLQSGINEAIRFMLKSYKSLDTISTQTSPKEVQNMDEIVNSSSSLFRSNESTDKQSNELGNELNDLVRKGSIGTEHIDEQGEDSFCNESNSQDFNSCLNLEQAECNTFPLFEFSSSHTLPLTHPQQNEFTLDKQLECQNSVPADRNSKGNNCDLDVKSSYPENIEISPQQISYENVWGEQSTKWVLPSAEEAVLKHGDTNKDNITCECNGEDEYLYEEINYSNGIKVSNTDECTSYDIGSIQQSNNSICESSSNDAWKCSRINSPMTQNKGLKCQRSRNVPTSQVQKESFPMNGSKPMSLLDCKTSEVFYTYPPQEHLDLTSCEGSRAAPLNGSITPVTKRKNTNNSCYKRQFTPNNQIRRRPTLLDEPRYSRYRESQPWTPEALFSYHDIRTLSSREKRFDASRKCTRPITSEWDESRNSSQKNTHQIKESRSLSSKLDNWRKNVFMQQNDLPTSLSSKWYFLSHSIEQINQLTAVAPATNRLTQLKELTKQHTLRVPPDAKTFLA
uniref:C2H2-type domain-containing protein n=1 Tax=Heterorhabditis bacteriophora TaxID=37862 RepID=A0A1I7XDH3_HETBA